jgi:uncharacterized membrane protein
VAVNWLSVLHSSVHMIRTQLSIGFKFHTVQAYYGNLLSFPRNIISLYTKLWHQLFFPHQIEVQRLTYEILVQLEGIISIVLPAFPYNKFKQPKLRSNPSIIDQIILRPLAIIDPYILALR